MRSHARIEKGRPAARQASSASSSAAAKRARILVEATTRCTHIGSGLLARMTATASMRSLATAGSVRGTSRAPPATAERTARGPRAPRTRCRARAGAAWACSWPKARGRGVHKGGAAETTLLGAGPRSEAGDAEGRAAVARCGRGRGCCRAARERAHRCGPLVDANQKCTRRSS